MIKAHQNKWAYRVFDIYLDRLLKSSFKEFYLVNDFPSLDAQKGLLVTANHFSWWDGFFVYYLLKKNTNKKVYVMMLEEQLKRYWFFAKLGCYSIDLQKAASTISTLRYTLDLLKDPGNSVLIFPQGEIEPYETRPIKFKGGIEFLIKHAKQDFQILNLAFKISYAEDKLPSVYALADKPLTSSLIIHHPHLHKESFNKNILALDSDIRNNKKTNLFKK